MRLHPGSRKDTRLGGGPTEKARGRREVPRSGNQTRRQAASPPWPYRLLEQHRDGLGTRPRLRPSRRRGAPGKFPGPDAPRAAAKFPRMPAPESQVAHVAQGGNGSPARPHLAGTRGVGCPGPVGQSPEAVHKGTRPRWSGVSGTAARARCWSRISPDSRPAPGPGLDSGARPRPPAPGFSPSVPHNTQAPTPPPSLRPQPPAPDPAPVRAYLRTTWEAPQLGPSPERRPQSPRHAPSSVLGRRAGCRRGCNSGGRGGGPYRARRATRGPPSPPLPSPGSACAQREPRPLRGPPAPPTRSQIFPLAPTPGPIRQPAPIG
ncbi:basic proline-rich protein-like [Loxodonta africana]|uniref:basic proline-rich protein-like n=1 Tax=Loxodonta africana TaxID=9785 RepID=UPI0030D17B1E